jgi:hypothetical protein
MTAKAKLLIVACVLVAFCAPCGGAQGPSARKKASAKSQARYTISGRIDGIPTPRRATVVATGHNRPSHSITTHADGTFIFHNLLPGTYEIRPRHNSFLFSPSFHTVALTSHDVGNVHFTARERPRKRR